MAESHATARFDFGKIAQRIRVPAGFALLPLLVVAARPTAASLLAGGLLSVAGLALRAWASGCVRKNSRLTTWGPYAYTRNPLYLGTFLLGAGVAISTASPWFLVLFCALYVLVYVPVMRAESETLRELFGEDYLEYSEKVPLFLPALRPYESAARATGSGDSFDRAQYRHHREYRAALGWLVIYGFLVALALAA